MCTLQIIQTLSALKIQFSVNSEVGINPILIGKPKAEILFFLNDELFEYKNSAF